jgi:hypothetical protein
MTAEIKKEKEEKKANLFSDNFVSLFSTSKFNQILVFFYSTFLFRFIMQTLSIFTPIKNFDKHVPIDHFHFKCETRIKEKLLN